MLATLASLEVAALADTPSQTAVQTAALSRLLTEVAATGYAFTTPTPATHHRYLSHCQRVQAESLRDIFGWNLPFSPRQLTPSILAHMLEAGVLVCGASPRSAVRIASLADDVFLHSSFPTDAASSVFFGPDTYRFARFIQQSLALYPRPDAPRRHTRILDIGCGSGAGGIVAARALEQRGHTCCITMGDINPTALHYAAINAEVAGIAVTLARSDGLAGVAGEFDLIISNPPYLYDDAQRAYRHGGAGLGRALSVRFANEALPRLAPGGMLLLYTGVAIVNGVDPFLTEMMPTLVQSGLQWTYTEIDPDVFGEELYRPVYQHADRIAAVGLQVTRVSTP